MKQLISRFCLALIFLALGCGMKQPGPSHVSTAQATFPDTRFLVISDPHFYDLSLGSSGQAFQDYLDKDRKLLIPSGEILETAVARMVQEKADFILVSGDLTKDGERICHEGVAKRLRPLIDSGKKVIVVPGNHDVSNPESVRYQGDETLPEPTVTPGEFKEIYQDFGFGQALFEDSHSLSYVTEPVEGLWILALDANRYQDNRPGHHAIVGGAFEKESLKWIEERLTDAGAANKAVIAVIHHGIMEHYPANEKFYDEYMVKEFRAVTRLLAAFGVRLVFTGHFHAQDITLAEVRFKEGQTRRIFDIETGSLVTAPCPIRKVEIKGNQARIKSEFILTIPSMGEAFEAYAADFVFDGTIKLANDKLDKFWVAPSEQGKINGQISRAYVTHLKGDEVRPDKAIDSNGFGLWLKFIAWYQKDLLDGWYTDLPPADNDLAIDLVLPF